ncbi:hypothetical protein D3C86_1784440 [compost metagenome]
MHMNLRRDSLRRQIGRDNAHRVAHLILELTQLFFGRRGFPLRFVDLTLQLDPRTDLDLLEEWQEQEEQCQSDKQRVTDERFSLGRKSSLNDKADPKVACGQPRWDGEQPVHTFVFNRTLFTRSVI